MKTITVRLQSDKDAELLMSLLQTTKFQNEIETFEEDESLSDEELQILNERIEEYRMDPSKGKNLQEVKELLKKRYNV